MSEIDDRPDAKNAKRRLTPAARRALAEAETRRKKTERRVAELSPETGGRGGGEPVRYGDWEVNGVATDF